MCMGAFDRQIGRSGRAFELLKIGLFHFFPHSREQRADCSNARGVAQGGAGDFEVLSA